MDERKKTFIMKVLIVALFILVLLGFHFVIAPYTQEHVPQEATISHTEETEHTGVDKTSQYLILVNKTHSIHSDYVPGDLKLVKERKKGIDKKYQKLRREAANAFDRLVIEAEEDGYKIVATTAFRSYAYQRELYNYYLSVDGKKAAQHYSAKPGYSEHETGLAVDISTAAVNYELVIKFGKSKEGKWVAKHCHKYGFIIRYPKGKEEITGYQYEPWHLRYVGRDAAKEIYKQDVTLEEYLGED